MNNQLTINELRAYQAGQLDGPARHRVERLLLEDPFYADALEGLEALQRTGASLPKQTAQLRRALHERINESATERRLFPLWVTTMAASIVLVMGVALYFIYTTNPATTAVKRTTIPTHSEPIVVEIGPTDSAIAKTVETVAVLEAHVARKRATASVASQSVSIQLAEMQRETKRPVRLQTTNPTMTTVIELVPARTGPEQIASAELALALDEPRPNHRRIINPERAFGPNAPEAPEVTFWSDASPRLTLAPTSASSRLMGTQEAVVMNNRSTTQSVSLDMPKDSAVNGILLPPVTVAGYITQSKRDITGAVSVLKPNSPPRSAFSQTGLLKTIEGTVTDQLGQPLPGVQIMVKGTKRGTTTNEAGRFSLDSTLVGGQPLTIAYVGFLNQELSPLSLKNGPIRLMEDTKALSEVVVTDYGRAKPKRSASRSVETPTTGIKVGRADGVSAYVTELSPSEGQAFLDYVKKEAAPFFQGPLEIRVNTGADGSIRRVTVEKDSRIHEEGQKWANRSFIPSPEVVAEAERLVRQYPNWPKKRQSLLWIVGWNTPANR